MRHETKVVFPLQFSETITAISKSIMLFPIQKEGIDRLLNSAKKEDKKALKKSHHQLLTLKNRLKDDTTEQNRLRERKLQDIYDDIHRQFNQCDKIIKSSTAGQLFDRQLHEYVKNSVDAKATEMFFTFDINDQDQVQITIADNGKIKIPTERLNRYNWLEIVLLDSQKNSEQLGGCNLGLATAANFLEKVGGGELQLAQRPEGGAIITLTSSTKTCDIDYFSFANYVCEMIHDLEKKSDECKKTPNEAVEKLKKKYHYPENFVSKRDKIMAPKPPMQLENSDVSTPLDNSRRGKRPPSLFSPLSAVTPTTPAGLSGVYSTTTNEQSEPPII